MKVCCIALFMFAGTVLAQPAAPQKLATIEGKVVDSVTKEPLRKVDVTLSSGSGENDAMEAAMSMFGGGPDSSPPAPKPAGKAFSATTDAAGKFRFDGVEPGDYSLKATHAGFADTTYKPTTGRAGEGKIKVAAADALTGIVLSLVPHGAVSGRVVDEDGDPVAGAMVSALSGKYSGSGKPLLFPVDTSPANNKGEFHLDKLPPGRYYLSANMHKMDFTGTSAAVPPPADGAPETGYVTTYFPGVVAVAEASKVDVAAGSDVPGFVIRLRQSRVARVKGQALTADGTPMKAGSVMLMNVSSLGSMQMGMVHPDGRFELANVQPGPYMLMVVEMKGAAPSIQMHSIVVPNEGLPDVKLASLPEGTIRGKITVSGDGAVKTTGLMVMLAPDENTPSIPVFGRVNEGGAFTLKASAAQYQVTLPSVPEGTYVKSVQWNNREMLGKPLDLSAGPSGDLLVALGTDGGTVDATVSGPDGKPAIESTVVLLPSDPVRRVKELTKSADTDGTGHVKFTGVPPGNYLAFAWRQVDDGSWFDPDFLKRYEKNGESVNVSAKGNQKAELKEIPEAP